MKAIVMDLRPYESLTKILEDVNVRLKKLGPVNCVSCYFSQSEGRFVGFIFTYDTYSRENFLFQVDGIRVPNPDEVEGILNEEMGKIEEAGIRMRYVRLYWRAEYVLILMTTGRRV